MRSDAETVDEYLAELPEDRREAVARVRDVFLANLPDGVVEVMNWGMITYEIPLATYPNTYNGQPLMFAALASQKRHMALYLHSIYADEAARDRFEQAYRESGKRMDIGKSCVRFRGLSDLPLDVVAVAIAAVDVPTYLETYERVHG